MSIEQEIIDDTGYKIAKVIRIQCRNILQLDLDLGVYGPVNCTKEEEDQRIIEMVDLAMRKLCSVGKPNVD